MEIHKFEDMAKEAVKTFWKNREIAKEKQESTGDADRGERSSVTGGKNMDGFTDLMKGIVVSNGLDESAVISGSHNASLPGYFRSKKDWDLVVINQERLVAALEFKSQVGSVGKNFNNRVEEAMGSAVDLWTAYSKNAFGEIPRPFVGWLILLREDQEALKPVNELSKNFKTFPEFKGTSYAERYNILCKKLVQQQFYTSASIILSKPEAINSGDYTELSDMTSLKTFMASFAGHVSAEAARGK